MSNGFPFRWLVGLSIAACLLVNAACHHNPTPVERGNSLAQLPLNPSQLEQLNNHILQSTVILLANKDLKTASVARLNPPADLPGVAGCGAILTEDGYILTVAHCLQNPAEMSVILKNPADNTLQLRPNVRVVWKGNPLDPHTDLAILKVSATNQIPFEFADRDQLANNDPIAGAGMCIRSNNLSTSYAGIILLPNVSSETLDGYDFHNVAVMVPCGPGDSGGPLVDSAGRLIGPIRSLNYFLSLNTHKFVNLNKSFNAIAPDPQWIRQIIQQHRTTPTPNPPKPQFPTPKAGPHAAYSLKLAIQYRQH